MLDEGQAKLLGLSSAGLVLKTAKLKRKRRYDRFAVRSTTRNHFLAARGQRRTQSDGTEPNEPRF
ncbi:MAG: hypothetical protein C5B58_11595 [Acidobacteria bacterium]|nr:MAG: hypothetical protein C5B58_11595 [Acidobacteriota bacterium]